MLDDTMVDRKIMRATLLRAMKNWDWKNIRAGGDPMMAMTAAHLGEDEASIQGLLMSQTKDSYSPNEHDSQMERSLLLYIPGSGGLLYAVAMMARGWDGAPEKHASGFPNDGSWTVRWEGLEIAS